jgi:hypothetical protein
MRGATRVGKGPADFTAYSGAGRLVMKPRTYSVLALVSWAIFFARLWQDQLSYWFWISFLVGFSAVYYTAQLYTGHSPEEMPKDRSRHEGVAAAFWGGFVLITADYLPPYWSQLFPLITILAVYVASRLWTGHKSEENFEDLPSPMGPEREV